MNKGKLFVLSGPSGSGKDTVRSAVMERNPQLRFSISYTSRPPRNNPIEDAKYHFVSREEFEAHIAAGDFLEHATFCGNYYGTYAPTIREWLENGENVLVEIDVEGQRQICEKIPEAVSIFIMPPSVRVLRKRLEGRNTEDSATIERRLSEAVREIKCAERYHYIVVNDELEDAIDEVCAILHGEVTVDRKANLNILKEVLENA